MDALTLAQKIAAVVALSPLNTEPVRVQFAFDIALKLIEDARFAERVTVSERPRSSGIGHHTIA